MSASQIASPYHETQHRQTRVKQNKTKHNWRSPRQLQIRTNPYNYLTRHFSTKMLPRSSHPHTNTRFACITQKKVPILKNHYPAVTGALVHCHPPTVVHSLLLILEISEMLTKLPTLRHSAPVHIRPSTGACVVR